MSDSKPLEKTLADELPIEVLNRLEEFIQAFSCSLDIDETLNLTLKNMMDYMRTEAASVFLVHEGEKLVCQACAGPVNLGGLSLNIGTGIVGKAVKNSTIELVRDVDATESFFAEVDRATGFKTRSILCAPLVIKDQTIGAIELINKMPSSDNPQGLFDENDKRLLSILCTSAALAIHNASMAQEVVRSESIRKELDIARSIQESFLPSFEAKDPFIGINLAAKNVSGDFFDYMRLPNGKYVFNIGDVSGKNLDAAMLMAKASSLYHCLAKTIDSPAEILSIINREVHEHATRGMFITMVGGSYDPVSKRVTLSNAGHVPAIKHDVHGNFTLYESMSVPLGILPDEEFDEVSFSIEQASLYLYTDGLSEGLARALQLPDELDNMKNLINRFTGVPRQNRLELFAEEATITGTRFDDLTVLLIEDAELNKS